MRSQTLCPCLVTSPCRLGDMVNAVAVERAGGDQRVRLGRVMKRVPEGFTGGQAHHLRSLAGVRFFEDVTVQDPDDPSRFYSFNLAGRLGGGAGAREWMV